MAGPVIWGPNSTANNLESNLQFSNGTGPTIKAPASPVDPSSVATAGNAGDLYVNNSIPATFQKQDSGTTTNWTRLGAAAYTAPTVQQFTSVTSPMGLVFIVSSANATVGATYTSNSNTYTVQGTISGGTLLFVSNAANPGGPTGTLTKISGIGDSTITYSAVQFTGTYTTPTNPAPLYLRAVMMGAGGGGSGGGEAGTSDGAGTNGADSYFGANLLNAGGGVGGPGGPNSGSGGSASLGSAVGLAIPGGPGAQGLIMFNLVNSYPAGGSGGSIMFASGGPGGIVSDGGAAAGYGGGGGGGGGGTGGNNLSGGGGGSGAYIDAIIYNPDPSYPFFVDVGGSGGAAGTNGYNGGSAAPGIIVIYEYYQ